MTELTGYETATTDLGGMLTASEPFGASGLVKQAFGLSYPGIKSPIGEEDRFARALSFPLSEPVSRDLAANLHGTLGENLLSDVGMTSSDRDSLLGVAENIAPYVGDLTETTIATITATANGEPAPLTAIRPEAVINGDFEISSNNERAPIVGDGLDERTWWTFDFTQDPKVLAFQRAESITSATLTLELSPRLGVATDTIGLEALGYVVSPEIQNLPLLEVSTVTIDLLDTYRSEEIIEALEKGEFGKFRMYYDDDAIVSFASLELTAEIAPIYESGVFTVGDTGQITTDFLLDGGGYEGDLAFFSLEGMETLNPESEAFIKEAARRSLTNSTLGHVVISDPVEGAKFDGELPFDGNPNDGEYSGRKTFAMTPGDRFGFMLIPDGWTSEVFDDPTIGGSKQPLFSMSTTDPDDDLDDQQFVDVTGHRTTLAWEDKRLPNSDRDYNDIVFHIEGATGAATQIDDLIAPEREWRSSPVGQELVQSVVDPLDLAGNTPDEAFRTLPSTVGKSFRGWVGSQDTADYYSFSLGMSNDFTLASNGNWEDITIEVIDLDGNSVYSFAETDTNSLAFNGTLEAGAYRVKVSKVDDTGTAYTLNLAVKPTIEGITTTGSELGGTSTVNQSLPLIGVEQFRSGDTDPRFADIDGSFGSTVVIDTGIDLDNSFFEGKLDFQFDFADDDGNADANNDEDNFHGSLVSSIVSSVAPGTKIIFLKVFPDGSDNAAFGDIEQALQWAIFNAETYNIHSVNMSLSDSLNWASVEDIVEAGLFDEVTGYGIQDELEVLARRNVINIAAAGNGYEGAQGVAYPSADPSVISVGAVFDSFFGQYEYPESENNPTGTDIIAPFSQRHEALVNIFAPGSLTESDIVSDFDLERLKDDEDRLGLLSGTSYAAPQIAGMVALAQQLSAKYLIRKLTPSEFTNLLVNTGVPIFDGDDENYEGLDSTQTWYRRADMLALANAIMDLRPPQDRDTDLYGSSFNVLEPSVNVGDPITIEYAIQNNGLDGAASFDVSFYLSPNAGITQSDLILGTVNVPGVLRNNNTGVLQTSFALPDALDESFWLALAASGGAAQVGMIVDVANTVGETDEFNNRNTGWLLDYDTLFINNIPPPTSGVLTVSIESVIALDDFDSRGRPRRRPADFYPIVTIDGRSEVREIIWNDDTPKVREVSPPWDFSRSVSVADGNLVPIVIQLFDDDNGGSTDGLEPDEDVDLNFAPGNNDLFLGFDLLTGQVSGSGIFGGNGVLLFSEGEKDDHARIGFRVFFTPIG
jgi:hypothetical protein